MLSFVVPAHDEALRLPATLASLHAAAQASGARYEIVVVDDASSDGTGALAAAAGVRVIRVEHRHIAATRNAGARAARGDRLVFVDADTLVPVATLRAALDALDAGAAGGGAATRLHGDMRWHERWITRLGVALLRLARIAPGCFIFCTRVAFEAAGGFDERYFAGEDIAMSYALARQGRFVLLREPVSSSARKLRTHSFREHLRLIGRVLVHGPTVLRSREALGLWYGPRREHDDAARDAAASRGPGRTRP